VSVKSAPPHESKQEDKEAVDEAMTDQFVAAQKLKVRVSPTHNGKQQLSQSSLFNSGPGPIFISFWQAEWGGGHARASVSTVRGKLPVRIEEQDVAELLVEIGDNLEELSGIGVVDGEGHWWKAGDGMLEVFKHEGISHRLPPLLTNESQQKSLKECEVEIETRASLDGAKPHLEVRFRNKSDMPIPIERARVSWKYDPPRKRPSPQGKVSAVEMENGVALARQSYCKTVAPGGEMVFVIGIADPLAAFLVELCRGDVKDDDIRIEITSKGFMWSGAKDEVPVAVRAVSQKLLEKMHAARS
jgi:hypothetical protein